MDRLFLHFLKIQGKIPPCFLISALRSLSMASSVATSRGSSPSLFMAPTLAPCSIRYLSNREIQSSFKPPPNKTKKKKHADAAQLSAPIFRPAAHAQRHRNNPSVACDGAPPVSTHLAIWMKPQEDAACRGVQPSLSPLLMSLPLSTRNCTISAFSSMQA